MLYHLLENIDLGMNGYGRFVWSSYGIAATLFIFLAMYAAYKKNNIISKLKLYFSLKSSKIK